MYFILRIFYFHSLKKKCKLNQIYIIFILFIFLEQKNYKEEELVFANVLEAVEGEHKGVGEEDMSTTYVIDGNEKI